MHHVVSLDLLLDCKNEGHEEFIHWCQLCKHLLLPLIPPLKVSKPQISCGNYISPLLFSLVFSSNCQGFCSGEQCGMMGGHKVLASILNALKLPA
jgi:hypothetical protein